MPVRPLRGLGMPSWLHSLLLGLLAVAPAALAAEQSARRQLADHYIDETQDNPGLFQGTPVSHVVPSFNTISYALAGEKADVTVTPEESARSDAKLRLTGYSVAPYLSLSLRRIGLGFSVENGKREADFSTSYAAGDGESRTSTVAYRGVGIFLYWIPVAKVMKVVTPTLILGGRSYTAKHIHSRYLSSAFSTNSADLNINYSVPNYEAGLNVDVALSRALHVIPWGNYSYMDTQDASRQASKLPYEEDVLETDIDLFWRARPAATYGIDLAARLGSLQVRLGGVLGLVANGGDESELIVDKSLRLAFSIEQKGR